MSRRVTQPGRAAFMALRDELLARQADHDLAAVWAEMNHAERHTVLRSAALIAQGDSVRPQDEWLTTPLLAMSPDNRLAIRQAIQRMSRFAHQLLDRARGPAMPPHHIAAQQALQAVDQHDLAEVRHLLNLIKQV